MTTAETGLLREVLGLIGGVREDMNTGFGEINVRLTSLERARIVTETTDELEDSLAQKRQSAFRFRVGVWMTAFFSGAGLLIAVAHTVFGIGG